MKHIRYRLEALLLGTLLMIFRAMPLDLASATGGWLGRTIGPSLAASRKAYRNLEYALPHLSGADRSRIVRDMWDNLGRVMAEYPHLDEIIKKRTEIIGEENIEAVGIDNPCILISAHMANWELFPFYFNSRKGWPVASIYRAPNNPYTARMLEKCRNPGQSNIYIAKSRNGVRKMVETLQRGGRLANLIDQKYNLGLAVPFFGKPAMTSPAFAQLAERFDCPILPLRIERVKGCNFRITLYPAFKVANRTHFEVLSRCHELFEEWIAERPGQWLWLHRRWNSRSLRTDQASSKSGADNL